MKQRYSVVKETASPPRVVLTFPFLWMAELMARAYGGEDRGYGVAITPSDPQTVLVLAMQRDQAQESLASLRATPPVGILFGLVARDDSGQWTTVHDADTPLPDHDQTALNIIFGRS